MSVGAGEGQGTQGPHTEVAVVEYFIDSQSMSCQAIPCKSLSQVAAGVEMQGPLVLALLMGFLELPRMRPPARVVAEARPLFGITRWSLVRGAAPALWRHPSGMGQRDTAPLADSGRGLLRFMVAVGIPARSALKRGPPLVNQLAAKVTVLVDILPLWELDMRVVDAVVEVVRVMVTELVAELVLLTVPTA